MTIHSEFTSLKVLPHKPRRGCEDIGRLLVQKVSSSSSSSARAPLKSFLKGRFSKSSKTFKMLSSTSSSPGRQQEASVIPTGFFLQNPATAFGTTNSNELGTFSGHNNENDIDNNNANNEGGDAANDLPNRNVAGLTQAVLQPRKSSHENLFGLSGMDVTDYVPVPPKSGNGMHGGAAGGPTAVAVAVAIGGGMAHGNPANNDDNNSDYGYGSDVANNGNVSPLFGMYMGFSTPVPRRVLMPPILGLNLGTVGDGMSPPRSLSLRPRAGANRSGSNIVRGVSRHHSETSVRYGSSDDSFSTATHHRQGSGNTIAGMRDLEDASQGGEVGSPPSMLPMLPSW